MSTLLLALLYPLLMAARVLNALTGLDVLRCTEPSESSLWQSRPTASSDEQYFSEDAAAPVDTGAARPVTRLLIWVARGYAPPRRQPGEKFSAAADREQGIPDEMYTLW